MKRIISVALCCCMVLTLFTGCGSKGKGQAMYYDIPGEPGNLDPQLASDTSSHIVLQNIMEGLLRMTEDGKLEEAAATDYEVSDDGLTYTFHLREDAVWYDGDEKTTPVTAKDFVYGFQRLFNPYTRSEYRDMYSAIEGAQEIISGTKSYQELGVSAPDDYTFVVRLAKKDPFFLQLVTLPAAFPCNQEFFESTKGRYGLSGEDILCNGPFTIYSWNEEQNIILSKNDKYTTSSVSPSSVSLYFISDSAETTKRFEAGNLDAAKLGSADLSFAQENGLEVISFDNTVWALLVNQKNETLQNANIRAALSLSLQRDSYAGVLPAYWKSASQLIPSTVSVSGENYRSHAQSVGVPYHPEEAMEKMSAGLSALGLDRLPKLTILCPDSDEAFASSLEYIKQVWQRDVSAFATVETMSLNNIYNKIGQGDYEMALIPITPSYDNPASILGQFLSGSGQNTAGYSNSAYDALLADQTGSAQKVVERFAQAEQMLLSDGVVLPLFYETSNYALDKGVTGIKFSPFDGGVFFRDARKKER